MYELPVLVWTCIDYIWACMHCDICHICIWTSIDWMWCKLWYMKWSWHLMQYIYELRVMLIWLESEIFVIKQKKRNLKINFAVCHHFLQCAMARHTAKLPFFCRVPVHVAHGKGGIVCRVPDHVAHDKLPTWHAGSTGQLYFAVGPIKHTAMALPCAQKRAHGKHPVCRPSFAVRCLPCVTHGKSFVECFWVFAVCFGTRQTHCFP